MPQTPPSPLRKKPAPKSQRPHSGRPLKTSFQRLKSSFPQAMLLSQKGEAYLDSASTSLKLQCAIDAVRRFYEKEASNVHRGDHRLSLEANKKYERARESAAKFLGARSANEIVFTKGATEGLNLLSFALGEKLKEGDEILISEMEHHSNFLPWQAMAARKGLRLRIIPAHEKGLDLKAVDQALSKKTKILSLVHVSNALGAVLPLKSLFKKAKALDALTVADGAQSASFMPVCVQDLDCDFFVLSGHKIFAPSGIGVLYGKEKALSALSPWQRGGGMIKSVSLTKAEWADSPYKFEAGTPPIEGALALGAALDFLMENADFREIQKMERKLANRAAEELSQIKGFKRIGPDEGNILSFIIEGLDVSDISFCMAREKACIRAGHHCCMPLMQKLGLPGGTLRASFSIYNEESDILILKKALSRAAAFLRSASR